MRSRVSVGEYVFSSWCSVIHFVVMEPSSTPYYQVKARTSRAGSISTLHIIFWLHRPCSELRWHSRVTRRLLILSHCRLPNHTVSFEKPARKTTVRLVFGKIIDNCVKLAKPLLLLRKCKRNQMSLFASQGAFSFHVWHFTAKISNREHWTFHLVCVTMC